MHRAPSDGGAGHVQDATSQRDRPGDRSAPPPARRRRGGPPGLLITLVVIAVIAVVLVILNGGTNVSYNASITNVEPLNPSQVAVTVQVTNSGSSSGTLPRARST